MNDDPEEEIRRRRLRAKYAAQDEFYHALGEAQTAWAAVEDGLFEWFKQCTGMNLQLARAAFYSARSFEGRRDMLRAVIPFSPCNEKTRTGIRLCIKVAGQYAAFRNRISHGHMIHLVGGDIPQIALTEGRTLSGPIDELVKCDDLRTAALNFRRLTDCLVGFHPDWQTESVCEQGCLEEIQALPSAANILKPSPND